VHFKLKQQVKLVNNFLMNCHEEEDYQLSFQLGFTM